MATPSFGVPYAPPHPGAPYPATGAWNASQSAGHRQFHTFATDRPFSLDGGAALRDVTIAFETWGSLNADASNAVLVCHAWTGDLSLIHI